MLNRISAHELHEWMAFYVIDAEEQAEADEKAIADAQQPRGQSMMRNL
ncbi:hypothetical protein [Streptomyces sp. DW26H14]